MRMLAILSLVAVAVSCGSVCSAMMTISASAVGPAGCGTTTAVVCPRGWPDLGRIEVTVIDTGWLVGDVWTVTATGPFCYNAVGENPQVWTPPAGTWVFVFDNMGGTGTITFSVVSSSGASVGPTPGMFVASTDLYASCRVDALDLSQFGQHYGRAYPAGDYNCDGVVNALDLAVFGTHYAH